MSNPFADEEDYLNEEEIITSDVASISVSSNDIAYVPVVEAITVNPFGDDGNDGNDGIRLNKETETTSSNPFGDDGNVTTNAPPPLPPKNRYKTNETMNSIPPTPPKRNENQGMSVAARRSSGPPLSFGVPNDTREKMPEPRKSVGLQRDPNSGLVSNPFDAPNEDKTRKVSLTFDKVNKSLLPLSADQRSILIHGWELNASIEALKLHHTSAVAVQKLYEQGKVSSNSNSLASLWKPPLLIRVGSWLPNYDDQSTGYIVTVTLGAAVNISWQVTLRYSKFLEFYQDVCRCLSKVKVDIEIMQNKFPQDRLSNWLKGMTDDVRNKRKTALDSWLRELFATPVHYYYSLLLFIITTISYNIFVHYYYYIVLNNRHFVITTITLGYHDNPSNI